MIECTRCKSFGLEYKRHYRPEEFLWGRPDSLVWVIGLNPKTRNGVNNDTRTAQELVHFLDDPGIVKADFFYNDYNVVSQRLFSLFGKPKGAAHTDLVKCYSKNFPPAGMRGKGVQKIIDNCSDYLRKQIEVLQPRMIICNGAPVCKEIRRLFPPPQSEDHGLTSYKTSIAEREIAIVLSGFIGRIDNYAKRRLGVEIDKYLTEYGLG
jgi:hypothetical protein